MAATKIRIDFHYKGFNQVRNAPGVVSDLERRAAAVAAAAGPGHEIRTLAGGNRVRARVSVRTATPEARLAEATNKTLSQAIGSAGRR